MAEVRITEGFERDLDIVTSERVLADILHVVEILPLVPTLGSTDVPESIARMFGKGVRKIPANPFDIVTEYHEAEDTVDVLGLVHQKAAW